MHNNGSEFTFMAVAAIAFILNITESALILKSRKRWKPFEKLLLSLSIADLIVATATIVYYSLALVGVTVKGRKLSTEYFIYVIILSEDYSVLHILIITVDRFMAVKYPIKHNMRMQGQLPNIFIAVVWVSVMIINGLFLLLAATAKDKVLITIRVFSAMLILLGICFAVAYRHMFQVVISQAIKRSTAHTKDNNAHCPIKEILFLEECKKERTMLITCCLVLSSYIICIYPASIETLIAKETSDISSISKVLLLTNSALNPLVYFFKGYRERRMRDNRREYLMKDTRTTRLTSSPQNMRGSDQDDDTYKINTTLIKDLVENRA